MKRILLTGFSFVLAAGLSASGSSAGTPAAGAPVAVDGGQSVFAANCAQCHSATSADTKVGPGLKGLFKKKTLPASGKPATVANVTAQIKNGGRGMPGFAELSAADVASLVDYLETL